MEKHDLIQDSYFMTALQAAIGLKHERVFVVVVFGLVIAASAN